jgi:uncharacterized protein YkwD
LLTLRPLSIFAIMLAAPAAHAAGATQLVHMINEFRAAPGSCGGMPFAAQAPFHTPQQLDAVHIGAGTFVDLALERVGIPATKADVLTVSEAADAASVMNIMRAKYCRNLRSAEFSALGVRRSGDEWTILLVQPEPPRVLPEPGEAGQAVLMAVNAARAQPRTCGDREFPPVGPVSWNPALGNAALAHSRNMAELRYFSHVEKNGSTVADRASHAGYRFQRVGENIASGQDSAVEAVAGWLDSPGHCANIMQPGYTEMGSAFALSGTGRLYWTQVFATPL